MRMIIWSFSFSWSCNSYNFHQDIEAWYCPFCSLRDRRSKFLLNGVHVFLCPNIVLILASRANPDEMPPCATFQLGLDYLPT